MKTYTKKIASILLIFEILFSTLVIRVPYTQAGLGVETDTNWSFHKIMDHAKTFFLDHAANLIAKQILHKLTAETVDWINGGFEGDPKFVSNPGGYFLDLADQATGAFLDFDNGPLKNLCGPLGSDLRLALAFGQTTPPDRRYTCTLGSIFENVKNIPGQTTINGRSLNGFMKGDFSQGGWKGFISMSQNPQNNGTGAYLQGHSDLLQVLGVQKNSVNKDLLEGHGFLSVPNCKDTTLSAVDDAGYGETDALNGTKGGSVVTGQTDLGETTSIKRKVDPKTGAVKYQNCETVTPGSAVAGLLQKATDSPVVELEVANDINAVVNALIGQMITKMTGGGGGLAGLSQRSSSGGGTSYTQQIIKDIQTGNQNQQAGLTVNTSSATEYKGLYDQAVALITDSKTRYQTARACFATKTGLNAGEQAYARNQISSIDTKVASVVDILLITLKNKQAIASGKLAQIDNNNNQVTDSQTTDTLRNQLPALEESVRINAEIAGDLAAHSGTAKTDLENAQTQAGQFNAEAARYQNSCENITEATRAFFFSTLNHQ